MLAAAVLGVPQAVSSGDATSLVAPAEDQSRWWVSPTYEEAPVGTEELFRPKNSPWLAPSLCPANLKGALFNHLSKTGGTAFYALLYASLVTNQTGTNRHLEDLGIPPRHMVAKDPAKGIKDYDGKTPLLAYQMDINEDGIISDVMADNYFVFGLTRKPCDFLLSNFIQGQLFMDHSNTDWGGPDGDRNKRLFREYVYKALNNSHEANGHFNTLHDALSTNMLSDRMSKRYGQHHVHCFTSTHNMKEDFKRCVAQYEACGGVVNHKFMTDAVLDNALAIAKQNAMGNGRKVGNHAACSTMFDAETIRAVKQHEGSLFFGSADCCSS